MALNVKFLKGTAAEYAAATKDLNTFYYTTDDSKVYLGTIELSTPAGVAAAIALVNDAEKGNEALKSAIDILNGNDTVTGSVAKSIADALEAALGTATMTTTAQTVKGAINELDAEIGDLSGLNTTTNTSLVGAINELEGVINTLTTDSEVTITKDTTSSNVAARYTIAQGGNNLPVTIDIPKDMVVESGAIVVDPQGQNPGKYIELTLANADEDKLYINVEDLVDVYTAKAGATQVQLAIDANNEISGSIVAGSINTTELAANAVTTAKIADDAIVTAKIADANVTSAKIAEGAIITNKIADANITVAKLDSDIQNSLNLANSAIQNIVEGANNGTISVDGTEVNVHGLGTAAYTNATAYATAAQGDKADTAVQNVVSGINNGTISVDGTEVAVTGLGGAAYKADNYYDLAGSANGALNSAINYIDEQLTWGTIA